MRTWFLQEAVQGRENLRRNASLVGIHDIYLLPIIRHTEDILRCIPTSKFHASRTKGLHLSHCSDTSPVWIRWSLTIQLHRFLTDIIVPASSRHFHPCPRLLARQLVGELHRMKMLLDIQRRRITCTRHGIRPLRRY